MVNHLKPEKKIAALSALVEGSSIRATERMVGVHRDTIMRLAVRTGKAAQRYMDENLRNLPCEHIQVDEVWGFVGKKAKNVKRDDIGMIGDVYCFSAMDQESKLVPCFKLGKRNKETVIPFIKDLAGRMTNRIQLSSDGLPAFYDAAVTAFGENVDYGQIVKYYEAEPKESERRYSPPNVVKAERRWIIGLPMRDRISTSHIERQNLTIRTFVRRLTRLTCAFSKKYENHEAALALHFLHYNFVRRHSTIKTTPATACGIADKPWTMADILEIADGS